MKGVQFDPNYLLLMEGSKAQQPIDGMLPAWDLYRGRLFDSLECWRNARVPLPTILILSAGWGLLEPQKPITPYSAVLDEGLAEMIADDDDHRALFRRCFEQAEHVLSVCTGPFDRVYRSWLKPGETYEWEHRGANAKGYAMRVFMERVPKRERRRAA